MKTLLSILLFILSFGSVFADEAAGTYGFYTQSVDNFCKPKNPNLWAERENMSLIIIDQIKYVDITNKNGDEYYKERLRNMNADSSSITLFGLKTGPTFLEKASYVYKETMGTIYACAVMNAKVRIIDNLLTKIPTTQSNIKQKLTNQLSYTRTSLEKKGCREIKDTSELSVKKPLLDNTTYQYCNYRQYLYYLENASKKSLDTYFAAVKEAKNPTDSSPLRNTDSAAREIAQAVGKIQTEIAHTKEVYPQAMVAFAEFEKTYASHILLEFILQDYIDLRDSLKKLLNPIGQVIYKASNAQSSGK